MRYEESMTFKATTTASAAIKLADVLEAEGDTKNADLFRQIADCSWEGLSALYDALHGKDDA